MYNPSLYRNNFSNTKSDNSHIFTLQKVKVSFSNAVKVMIFISDVQNYVPIKLCKTVGSIHLFKIRGMLKTENIKLNKNYLWDTLEIDWKEVTVTCNGNKIDLSKVVVIKLQVKIEVRKLMNREPLLFHLMLK